VHEGKLRFLEIGVYPEGIGVRDRDLVPSNGGIVTRLRDEIGHPAIQRRADLCALQVNLGLIAVGCVSARGLTIIGDSVPSFQFNQIKGMEGYR
jgi:hypothetical protein